MSIEGSKDLIDYAEAKIERRGRLRAPQRADKARYSISFILSSVLVGAS